MIDILQSRTMVFTSNALLALFAFAPAALAIPGPTWYKRQADAQTSLSASSDARASTHP